MKTKILSIFSALFCIIVWGTTFISTKVLLKSFDPTTILIYRLLICITLLIIMYPHIFKTRNKKDELYFFLAGASGIAFYFLFENFSLKYTSASSVGIIVSIAPMFTLLFCAVAFKDSKITINFIIGFIVAIIGIVLISLDSKNESSEISVKGVLLAIAAMMCWGMYSVFVKKINNLGYQGIGVTRKIMYYGLICLIPFWFILKGDFNIVALKNVKIISNLLFLGIVASTMCFLLWNYALRHMGPVKCNIYLYISPAITMIASALILGEKITLIIIIGMILSVLGLVISNDIWHKKKLKENSKNDNILKGD